MPSMAKSKASFAARVVREPPPSEAALAAIRAFRRVVMSTGAVGSGGTAASSGTGGLGNDVFPFMQRMTHPSREATIFLGIFLYPKLTVFVCFFMFRVFLFVLLF